MKKKIIIGIHGLGNKPTKGLLKEWWKKSIREGLKKNGHPKRFFKFKLVYWANYLHSKPLNPRIKDEKSLLYIKNPYAPAYSNGVTHTPSQLKKKSLDFLERTLDKLFFAENRFLNFDVISDFIIQRKFKDLDIYYRQDNEGKAKSARAAKELIRQELATTLKKHQGRDILLIAHSMGSIVAYDVLTQVVPEINIHTFMTIGSPLGLPVIMKKIFSDQNKDYKKEKKVATPENIAKSWVNFSDLDDKIALNYDLADDYKKNSHQVGPVDTIVHNDYEYQGAKNPHKSYGYLRAPEVAEVIHKFLSENKLTPFESLRNNLETFIRNIIKSK